MIGFFMGLVSHQMNGEINEWTNTPKQWRLLARYTIGGFAVLCTHFVRVWIRRGRVRAVYETESMFLAFGSVGLGVGFGYIIDEVVAKRVGEGE